MRLKQLAGISPQMETREPGATWGERGLCRDSETPDDWFGGPDNGKAPRASLIASAKAECAQCPVKAACLAFAVENKEREGVWGGVDFADPIERRGARSTVCARGHLIEPGNIRVHSDGRTSCRLCYNAHRRAKYARRKELEQRIVKQSAQLDRIVAERMDGAA